VTIGIGLLDGAVRDVDVARARDFDAFVAAHRDRAVGLAWRLVGGDAAAAEDVAQEALLWAYRGLHQFREEAKMSTWFYRILVNEAQRHLRWRWVRERVAGEMPEEPLELRPEAAGDPILRERVTQAVGHLPRDRQSPRGARGSRPP